MNNFHFSENINSIFYEALAQRREGYILTVAVFSIKKRMIPMLYVDETFIAFSKNDLDFIRDGLDDGFDVSKNLEEVYLFDVSALNEAFWNGAPDVANHGILVWKNKRREKMLEKLSNKKEQLKQLQKEIRKLEDYLNK